MLRLRHLTQNNPCGSMQICGQQTHKKFNYASIETSYLLWIVYPYDPPDKGAGFTGYLFLKHYFFGRQHI